VEEPRAVQEERACRDFCQRFYESCRTGCVDAGVTTDAGR
jgi:hypothetical protein